MSSRNVAGDACPTPAPGAASASSRDPKDYTAGGTLRIARLNFLTRAKIPSASFLTVVYPASAHIALVTGDSLPPSRPQEISRADGKSIQTHSEAIQGWKPLSLLFHPSPPALLSPSQLYSCLAFHFSGCLSATVPAAGSSESPSIPTSVLDALQVVYQISWLLWYLENSSVLPGVAPGSH